MPWFCDRNAAGMRQRTRVIEPPAGYRCSFQNDTEFLSQCTDALKGRAKNKFGLFKAMRVWQFIWTLFGIIDA
jgi:hypothetical protein